MDKVSNTYVLTLICIILVLYLLNFFVKRTLNRLLKKTNVLQEKNRETVINVLKHSMTGVSIGIVLLYSVSPFIKLDKILAGAGILGIVIGFASQNLLKDLLAGFFRISTKQIHRGDLVMINGKYRGRVEEIGVLYLQIREWDGKLTTVNNGEIKEIQNFNMEKMRIIVDVVVSFRESPEKILGLLEEVCHALNEEHSHLLLEGEEEEPYRVYGLTSTNEQFFGYKYSLVGLVKDDVYFDAMNHARLLLAQKMHDNNIQMAEQQIYYTQRAELKRLEEEKLNKMKTNEMK